MRSTNHESPHFAIFCSLLLLPLLRPLTSSEKFCLSVGTLLDFYTLVLMAYVNQC